MLVIQEREVCTVAVRRCGPLQHLAVRARGQRLDERLALGVNPDSSCQLSLRARRLLHPATRQGLAHELRSVLARAPQARAWLDPTVPLASASILENRGAIEEICELLEGEVPVDVRGIAQARVLLYDGGSPIYRSGGGELEPALEELSAALDPFQCLV